MSTPRKASPRSAEMGGNLENLAGVARLVGGNEPCPLVGGEDAEPRVLVNDPAQRDALAGDQRLPERAAGGLETGPGSVGLEAAGMNRLRGDATLRANGEQRLDRRRQ